MAGMSPCQTASELLRSQNSGMTYLWHHQLRASILPNSDSKHEENARPVSTEVHSLGVSQFLKICYFSCWKRFLISSQFRIRYNFFLSQKLLNVHIYEVLTAILRI